jgi:hypothetical protein
LGRRIALRDTGEHQAGRIKHASRFSFSLEGQLPGYEPCERNRAGAQKARRYLRTLGQLFCGCLAGQVFGVITYPDWETYGKAMQSLTSDPEYQRIMAGLTSTFELQERWLASIEDL